VQNGFAHVVFIDDSCLEMKSFKNFQLRTQNLIQEGVPIILLADEQTKQEKGWEFVEKECCLRCWCNDHLTQKCYFSR